MMKCIYIMYHLVSWFSYSYYILVCPYNCNQMFNICLKIIRRYTNNMVHRDHHYTLIYQSIYLCHF
eukprot:UN05454